MSGMRLICWLISSPEISCLNGTAPVFGFHLNLHLLLFLIIIFIIVMMMMMMIFFIIVIFVAFINCSDSNCAIYL